MFTHSSCRAGELVEADKDCPENGFSRQVLFPSMATSFSPKSTSFICFHFNGPDFLVADPMTLPMAEKRFEFWRVSRCCESDRDGPWRRGNCFFHPSTFCSLFCSVGRVSRRWPCHLQIVFLKFSEEKNGVVSVRVLTLSAPVYGEEYVLVRSAPTGSCNQRRTREPLLADCTFWRRTFDSLFIKLTPSPWKNVLGLEDLLAIFINYTGPCSVSVIFCMKKRWNLI